MHNDYDDNELEFNNSMTRSPHIVAFVMER